MVDVTISIPNENGEGSTEHTLGSLEDWQGFCENLRDECGEGFQSGAEGQKAIYEGLLTASRVEYSPVES